jgi:membrane protease YdiL (CAAX protease family)
MLALRQKSILALVCLCAGAAPLLGRWIPDQGARIAYAVVITAAYLAFALFTKRQSSLRDFQELKLAFFVLALFTVLNGTVPGFVGAAILHDPPNGGDPLASTVSGTVVIQLVDTLIAIVPVIIFARLSGRDLGSIYLRKGIGGRWLVLAIVFLVLFYVFLATIPLRPDSFVQRVLPTNGIVTIDRFLALSPALIVDSIANGFEEEVLFRGFFLETYDAFFNPRVSNALQAAIFAVAHAGVTYTPSAVFFVVVIVFPLGLIAGYLMRATRSVITPGIFHGALDLAIYLVFLSYAS